MTSTYRFYKVINDIDDKVYVGCTTKKLSKRLYQHKQPYRDKTLFYKHVHEIGADHFSIELLEEREFEDPKKIEQIWVDRLKPELNKYRSCVALK